MAGQALTGPTRGLRRIRLAFGVFLANVVGVLLVLALMEGAARAVGIQARGAGRGDRALWRYEPLRGWGLVPGSSGEDFRGGPDRGTVRINAQGFRGEDFARTKGRDTRRILVLGDSFAFGAGVDEPHMVSTRLHDFVNADRDLTGGHHVDVLNLAVSGYSTDQQLLTFESDGALLDPDVVILLMCDNDFEGNMEAFSYARYYKPRFRLEGGALRLVDSPAPRAERRRPLRTWLFDNSAFAAGLARFRALAPLLSPGAAPRTRSSPEELMVALLGRLNDDVSQSGARLVVFNTGHRGEKTPLFHTIRPHLDAMGIAHLGLEDALGQARAKHPEIRWDFGDDTHWNVAAHELAARVMHLHLRGLARAGRIRLDP